MPLHASAHFSRPGARPAGLFFWTDEGGMTFLMVVNGAVSSDISLFPAPYNQK
jgi:hypothetical protein